MKPSLLEIITAAIAAVDHPNTPLYALSELDRVDYAAKGMAAMSAALGGCDFVIKATYQDEPDFGNYQNCTNRKEAAAFDIELIESERASVEDILEACDIEIIQAP